MFRFFNIDFDIIRSEIDFYGLCVRKFSVKKERFLIKLASFLLKLTESIIGRRRADVEFKTVVRVGVHKLNPIK